jgi:protein-tyrosine-phosphatase
MHSQLGQRRLASPAVAQEAGRSIVPYVLFVCVQNAGRSRMAEAFFNHMAGDEIRALSAGTQPADRPHPEVVNAMREAHVPIWGGPGTMLTPELADSAVKVIGMGCAVEEACPALQVPLEDWKLDDPAGGTPEEVATIRDMIEMRVRNLIGQLNRVQG